MQWPEKVTVPLLMILLADDGEVPVSQALMFAEKLSSLRKDYELIVYAKEIHEALNNRRDRDARIVAWFRRNLRIAAFQRTVVESWQDLAKAVGVQEMIYSSDFPVVRHAGAAVA